MRMRKDTLKRLIENGKLEARLSYAYDGRSVRQDTEFKPARMYNGEWEDRIEGKLNFNALLYGIWRVWRHTEGSGLITLYIADENYELRYA